MDRNTEVMYIRIPKDLAAKMREISRQENTHLGTALKFLIEQGANERIETKLTDLEEKIKELISQILDFRHLDTQNQHFIGSILADYDKILGLNIDKCIENAKQVKQLFKKRGSKSHLVDVYLKDLEGFKEKRSASTEKHLKR